MDLRLAGKKAVVTGASRGIGRAIALGLAAEGVDLVVTGSRVGEALLKTAAMAGELGVSARAVGADMGTEKAVLAMMEEALETLGEIDILVNNAGVFLQGWSWELPLEDWRRTLDINLTGAFIASQYFARVNLERGRPGRIVNINSQAAFNGSTSGHAHYAASKAGMTAMTISMARELSAQGITVVGLAPGIVKTEMIKDSLQEDPTRYAERIVMGRAAEAFEIADAAVFLASERAGYITGATIDISGGMLMR